MFAINPFFQGYGGNDESNYDFNSLIDYLQERHQQQQFEQSRPKIVKKIENEDSYQIQVYKKFGDFNNYEVKAIKVPNTYANQPQLINIVLQSAKDQFKKVFQFRLDDVLVDQINWEWYKAENILVLNIPKRVKVCHSSSVEDLATLLGFPFFYQDRNAEVNRSDEVDSVRKQQAERQARFEAQQKAQAEFKARQEAERARQEAEERARREAEERARKEAEERARKEAELRAKREAELKAKREAEIKAKKEAMIKAKKEAKLREEEKLQQQREAYDKYLQQQQEFFNQFFNGNLFHKSTSPFEFASTPSPVRSPKPQQQYQPQPQSHSQAMQRPVESDNESIDSENEKTTPNVTVSTPPPASVAAEKLSPPTSPESDGMQKLHKHPSLEEVEDEEFVMFNKKFNH
ncbi:uncharacterized protein RJT21DRAFT_126794 [Scheffersomyces amazonensis]|uniref:uncharacterized protein n=1 Tax=Scheffersomyces amazonensis TaxID=1078765 RepID=UPI00315C57C7